MAHGMYGTPTYNVWALMLKRCRSQGRPDYARYGGRGITVCERWSRFENFLADMGERPAGKTLDRIDNHGNYEPGNCRWATASEQCRNTRRNNNLTLNGVTRCATEWAELTGLPVSTIKVRKRHGWPDVDALTAPPGARLAGKGSSW